MTLNPKEEARTILTHQREDHVCDKCLNNIEIALEKRDQEILNLKSQVSKLNQYETKTVNVVKFHRLEDENAALKQEVEDYRQGWLLRGRQLNEEAKQVEDLKREVEGVKKDYVKMYDKRIEADENSEKMNQKIWSLQGKNITLEAKLGVAVEALAGIAVGDHTNCPKNNLYHVRCYSVLAKEALTKLGEKCKTCNGLGYEQFPNYTNIKCRDCGGEK